MDPLRFETVATELQELMTYALTGDGLSRLTKQVLMLTDDSKPGRAALFVEWHTGHHFTIDLRNDWISRLGALVTSADPQSKKE